MKPLRTNVIFKKETVAYSGLIQGVSDDSSTIGRVLSIGDEVTDVKLNEKILVNWKMAKNVNADLWLINQDDIVAVLDE